MPPLPLPEGPEPLAVLHGHAGPVHAAIFSRDGAYCLTAGADRSVRLWNPLSAVCIKSYLAHGKDVLGIALPHAKSDNNRFATCSIDRTVILWDVSTGANVRRFTEHRHRVNSLDFNADASVLVSGSYDATALIWDLKSQSRRPVQALEGAKDSIEAVQVLGHEILTGSVDGSVRVYDIRFGKIVEDKILQSVTHARFSNDGNCILASSLDNTIRLLDKESGDMLNEYKGHKNSEYRIISTLSYNDSHVISGSEDGQIYMWDLVEANVVRTIRAHAKAVTCVAYHPSNHSMISTSLDGFAKTWIKP